MTGGGPENGTLVLAFVHLSAGLPVLRYRLRLGARAMIMFVIVMVLTIVQLAVRRRDT